MNELSRHIEILLLDNDCVIVPGFGGFMAHHRPAEYVAEAGLFYPPQRTLGFNPQLTINDSLLVQSYVEAYDISYPEAVKRIESEVAEIRQKIVIEGLYEFHGIGVITQGADGKYDFEPCTAGLLTPDLYALNSFAVEPMEHVLPTLEMPVVPLDANDEDEPSQQTEEPEETYDARTIEIKLHTLRNILVAAIVLLLFVFSSIPVGVGSNKVLTCSVIDTEFISSFIKENALLSKAESPSAAETAPAIAAPKDTIEASEPASEAYAIVLASRVTKSGAERYVAELVNAGLKEARMVQKGHMCKVVYGAYESADDAQAALRQLRQLGETFADAWIIRN